MMKLFTPAAVAGTLLAVMALPGQALSQTRSLANSTSGLTQSAAPVPHGDRPDALELSFELDDFPRALRPRRRGQRVRERRVGCWFGRRWQRQSVATDRELEQERVECRARSVPARGSERGHREIQQGCMGRRAKPQRGADRTLERSDLEGGPESRCWSGHLTARRPSPCRLTTSGLWGRMRLTASSPTRSSSTGMGRVDGNCGAEPQRQRSEQPPAGGDGGVRRRRVGGGRFPRRRQCLSDADRALGRHRLDASFRARTAQVPKPGCSAWPPSPAPISGRRETAAAGR